MTLILIGYMGSGKSSVGEKLAKLLNYDFIDLDDYIERNLNMKINKVFETKGEIFFRKQESIYLKEIMNKKRAIVSLGGGTPCYGNNLKILKDKDDATLIYLKASIQNLTDRLFLEKSSRPLIAHLNTKTEALEFIGKHLFERAPYYEESDITIKTDSLSIEQIVQSILLKLF